MKKTCNGFSLIEIMVGILIVSIIIVTAFQALGSVGIAKVKLIEKTEIEKQAYFSSERFFERIKKGGTLDYEEYWNRYSYDTSYNAGHFSLSSGFGNYGSSGVIESLTFGGRPYNCISNSGFMGTGGCLRSKNISYNFIGRNRDRVGNPQRYSQYELQFIDRNSDNDIDNGDEDGDGNILGDDDDLFLGIGPEAFSGTTFKNKVGELYLISNDGRERTYFRWHVETATGSFLTPGADCNYTNPENPIGEACHGNIEILQLSGRDYGYDHTLSGLPDSDGSQGDGIIDTWLIHEDYTSGEGEVIAGVNTTNYWQKLFPDTINIKNFEIFAYPNKDLELSWKDSTPEILVSPYVRVKYTLEPSLKIKAKIAGVSPSVDFATTIQLSNLDIR